MCRLSLNFISSPRLEGLQQHFLFQDQDYQSKNHMRGQKKSWKKRWCQIKLHISWYPCLLCTCRGTERRPKIINILLAAQCRTKCPLNAHTHDTLPLVGGLDGLKRLTADRQTYKRRKYFLTFSFNKLSNFRSNKDKHSTHSSQKHALLSYHQKSGRKNRKMCFFPSLCAFGSGHFHL